MAGFCSSLALAWESWAGWSNTEPAGVAGDLQAHGLKAKLEGLEKAERFGGSRPGAVYRKKLEASVVGKMELLYPFGIYYTFHDGSRNSRVGDPLQCVSCSSSGISLALLRPRCSHRSPQVCML